LTAAGEVERNDGRRIFGVLYTGTDTERHDADLLRVVVATIDLDGDLCGER